MATIQNIDEVVRLCIKHKLTDDEIRAIALTMNSMISAIFIMSLKREGREVSI